jgi:hypothetical protein
LCLIPTAGPLGLVVYRVSSTSLPAGVATVAAIGVGGYAIVVRVTRRVGAPEFGRFLASRFADGAFAGIVATFAYDIGRYGILALVEFSIRPFDVWRLFGTLFVPHASTRFAYAIGYSYHMANGLGLGIAFRLLARNPTVVAGIAWALVLEFAMALLYPSWLRITALEEFLTISVLGHLIYGSVLALMCRQLDRRRVGIATP